MDVEEVLEGRMLGFDPAMGVLECEGLEAGREEEDGEGKGTKVLELEAETRG